MPRAKRFEATSMETAPVKLALETKLELVTLLGITDKNHYKDLNKAEKKHCRKVISDVEDILTKHLYIAGNPAPTPGNMIAALTPLHKAAAYLLKEFSLLLKDRVLLSRLSLESSDKKNLPGILERVLERFAFVIRGQESIKKEHGKYDDFYLPRTIKTLAEDFIYFACEGYRNIKNLNAFLETALFEANIRHTPDNKSRLLSRLSEEDKAQLKSIVLLTPHSREDDKAFVETLMKPTPPKKIRRKKPFANFTKAKTKRPGRTWSEIDKLKGEAYEKALDQLTTEERNQYLEDLYRPQSKSVNS